MPIMLRMQLPRETDRSSLGEKLSPLPWLSFGASVVMTIPDSWVAVQCNEPSYVTVIALIGGNCPTQRLNGDSTGSVP